MSLPYWDKVKYGQYENTRPDRNHALAEGGRKVKDDDQKQEVKPHNEWTPYAGPVVWTGPDGDRDFRPRLFKDWQLLGIGDVSSEKTLSATYISRAPQDQPFGKPRNEMIGEIGWFYKNYEHAIIPSIPEYMER
ncbi:uncharacterized protein LOC123537414 [Mercenaria mercenaria]|uniref:uncharacterized protein LOC123537414 n=1 Tax=Mercenaria mercenaria TaxID=6596 RepID=UPI00234EA54D|nr:uncharacterized protein LOC123537414 [Mercenaria mercenaria]